MHPTTIAMIDDQILHFYFGVTLMISTPWPSTSAEKLLSCRPRSFRFHTSRTTAVSDFMVGPRVLQATVTFAVEAPVPSKTLVGRRQSW